jgi:membrane-associated phospholipid phosphatase
MNRLLLLFSTEPIDQSLLPMIVAIALFFFCINPIVTIIYFTIKGKVDIWVSERKTRTPFYLIAIAGYIIASVLFHYIHTHDFFVLSIAYIGVTTTVLLANFKTKISSHGAGLTGPFTAVLFILGPTAIALFLFLPIVFWSRLRLQAHTFTQFIAGSFVGIIVTSVIFYIIY